MSRYLYTLFFYIALPFLFLRLLLKRRKAPEYGKRWRERLGFIQCRSLKNAIWVHAVSFGEVNVAIPLIKALRKQYPESDVVVTSMTPTGSQRIQSVFSNQVFHVYVPYDLPDAIHRFFKKINPSILVAIETELWPNLFHICKKKHVPIIIANARLSPRSFKGYAFLKKITAKMLSAVTLVAAQSQMDAERFIALGMDPQKVTLTGNIKFDVDLPENLFAKAQTLRDTWGPHRPVWIAASTHPGEEKIILEAFAKLRKHFSDLLLVLVPRHPDRFTAVAELCKSEHYHVALHSHRLPNVQTADIVVGDTMGELFILYAASDIAFVGGSFVEIGGHNLLEPAAVGKPALTGPHLFNFVEIYRLLHEARATLMVNNSEELFQETSRLLKDAALCKHMGEQGQKTVELNRGAVQKHLELLGNLLKNTPTVLEKS